MSGEDWHFDTQTKSLTPREVKSLKDRLRRQDATIKKVSGVGRSTIDQAQELNIINSATARVVKAIGVNINEKAKEEA